MMGCAPSGESYKRGGIRLMSTKLTFTKDQLCSLNTYFRKLVEEARPKNDSSNVAAIEAIVEKLVQRLMLGAANLDPRFSSMFLVSLNEPRRVKQMKFEYLLRLDALSTPLVNREIETVVSVEEDAGMPGFIRLKILGPGVESWHEYVDAEGRLRRDLLKTKLTNLLATTIKRDVTGTVDDKICITPGQVVHAEVLDKILKQPNHARIFYGPAVNEESLPESRNHRVALIEDVGGILLRIGLDGYKTPDIEVRLLIGIGVSRWSNLADFPRRIPLHHCDALLHYTVAQSGMYAVAVGPYTGARCDDRATLWRVRVPAGEKIMNQHYANDSAPALTESVLMEILYQLRSEGSPLNLSMKPKDLRKSAASCSQDRLRVVSRHILRTIHRWSLERTGPDPLTSWTPDSLSRHVLLALDELVTALKCQNLRCYFHPRCNVMLQCAKGGIVHHEDSYVSDSRLLESYLTTLHHRSFSMKPGVPRPVDIMENELIIKWRSIMASLPRGTMNADYGYNSRQLEYFSLILEEVLRARDIALQEHGHNGLLQNFPELSYHGTEQVENLVYLLKLILMQARDQIISMSNRRARTRERPRILRKKRHCNTTSHFDYSVGLLIDIVRRDRTTANMDLEVHPIMAKTLLRWLFFGMQYDAKILEPILRPYLSNLFNGLHENGWYAESWKRQKEIYTSEMQSLSLFCKLVTTRKLSAASGIVDFLSKGWCWAESVTRMIERSDNSLRLILITPQGEVIRYKLNFIGNKGPSAFPTWSKARSMSAIARRRRVNSRTSDILDSLLDSDSTGRFVGEKGHVELRDVSPLTYVASMSSPRLRQRGPGDLVSAIISLGKFRILQEVAGLLPRDERVTMLDMIQRVARETSRSLKKSSFPETSARNSPKQTYTPRPESDLLDTPPRLAERFHEARIIAEHQKQLQREMQEMQVTPRRTLRLRQCSSIWDSASVSSWTSSIDSSGGTISRRKYHRVPIWGITRSRGNSPGRDINTRNKFDEMISREESPTWNTSDNRRKLDDFKNGDQLPSWDTLEATLNKKLSNYEKPLVAESKP